MIKKEVYKLKCLKCGSENTVITFNLGIQTEGKDYRKITKEVLKKKETKILFANWDSAVLICLNCQNRSRGL